MHLLEEEMVIDKLLLSGWFHTFERIEGTFEITFEGIASGDNFLHDLVSLSLADSWAERVAIQVSSNSDSCGLDHCGVFFNELSVFDTIRGHVRGVLGLWTVLVVVGDALVEKLVEGFVGIVRSGVDSNTGVLVGDTREDASFESNALRA